MRDATVCFHDSWIISCSHSNVRASGFFISSWTLAISGLFLTCRMITILGEKWLATLLWVFISLMRADGNWVSFRVLIINLCIPWGKCPLGVTGPCLNWPAWCFWVPEVYFVFDINFHLYVPLTVAVPMMLCDVQVTNQSAFSPVACAVSDTPMPPAASPEAWGHRHGFSLKGLELWFCIKLDMSMQHRQTSYPSPLNIGIAGIGHHIYFLSILTYKFKGFHPTLS